MRTTLLSLALFTLPLCAQSSQQECTPAIPLPSSSSSTCLSSSPCSADIAVYGGGLAGVAAAIQAKNALPNAVVILYEPTDSIGGQIAAGVGTIDIGTYGTTPDCTTTGNCAGIWGVFWQGVKNYYSNWMLPKAGVEPWVAEKQLKQMLCNNNVAWITGKLTGRMLIGNFDTTTSSYSGMPGITTVRFVDGTIGAAKVWIDASEYGDLVAAADNIRVGNSNSENPPLNPDSTVQDITWNAMVTDKSNLDPTPIKNNNVAPPGYAAQNFSPYLTATAPPPPSTPPLGQQVWNPLLSYRWVPNTNTNPVTVYGLGADNQGNYLQTLTSLNHPVQDYPSKASDVIYTPLGVFGQTHYVSPPATRGITECEARLQTLRYLYYILHDLNLTSQWWVELDSSGQTGQMMKGFDTPYNEGQVSWCRANDSNWNMMDSRWDAVAYNLPSQAYVREGARGTAPYTMAWSDVYRPVQNGASAKYFPTAVAIGEYNFDMHDAIVPFQYDCLQVVYAALEPIDFQYPPQFDVSFGAQNCNRPGQPGQLISGPAIPPNNNGPFQIPYESLFSKQYGNLIYAGKTISQTRVVEGVTRIHIAEMEIGQAAGMIAALVDQYNVAPRYINPYYLQWILLNGNVALNGNVIVFGNATVKDANGSPLFAGAAISPYQFSDVSPGPANVSPCPANVSACWPAVQMVTAHRLLTSNLALGKTATQSSTYPGSPSAMAAVDDNIDGNYFDNSVTATSGDPNQDPNPWWQVDLGSPATISSVVIFNRTDCCSDRLSDFWVFASNTPFKPGDTHATLQNQPGVVCNHQTTAPNPSSVVPLNPGLCTTPAPDGLYRYIRVQLNSSGYLSLAEMQVYGPFGANPSPANGYFGINSPTITRRNVAAAVAKRFAYHLGDRSDPFRTNPPNTDGRMIADVSSTDPFYPYIDWLMTQQIFSGCNGSRTSFCPDAATTRGDAAIFLGMAMTGNFSCQPPAGTSWVTNFPFDDSNSLSSIQQTCASVAVSAGVMSTQSGSMNINSLLPKADFINIMAKSILYGPDIYQSLPIPGPTFTAAVPLQLKDTAPLAAGWIASESSNYPGTRSAVAAIDSHGFNTQDPHYALQYFTDGNYFDNSVTATSGDPNQDPNPWWQVDLGSLQSVSSVTLWNRTDCCSNRLSDFWVFASNTPFQPGDTPATLQNRAGVVCNHQTTAPNPFSVVSVNGGQCTTPASNGLYRYIRVQLSSSGYLSLAEVQVNQ